MDARREFHIPPAMQGLALETALKRLLRDQSWSQVRALIAGRFIKLNGALAIDQMRRITPGDLIERLTHAQPPPPGDSDVQIVHRDEHLVIVEKPAGMISLRRPEEQAWDEAKKQAAPALEESVARLVQRRVYDVHRLDRDTSGLMLFALSTAAKTALIEMFKKHAIDRRYRAMVHGHPGEMQFDTWLVRDRGDGLRGSLPAGMTRAVLERRQAERAITAITPITRMGPYSIVECRLATGRTHQIRIHLAEAGFKLCGERVYTHSLRQTPQADTSGAPRQALHSWRLKMIHPVNQSPLEFESDWPADLKAWLGTLGLLERFSV